ncbi:MAG: alanine racemase [Candidatus Cloacimonetes bacterium]|nr:alanine racemase [Candidatus Cloacimonadota bacterium]
MAELIINHNKIIQNIKKLDEYLNKNNINWTLVTKVLSGNYNVLKEILQNDIIKNCHSIGDSRLSSLKTIKSIRPDIVTMYIKLPALISAASVVKYADISLNSSYKTIEALNREAEKQEKIHRVIVMIEMGELREGVIREDLLRFYEQVFKLSNIEIIGLGTNLGCMYGVEPSYDKLIQLSLYRQLLEAKFDRKIELISGGSSITLPLIGMKKIPASVNHFRIGEAAFLGTTPLTGKKYQQLYTNAFEFKSNIIEMALKEGSPDGIIGEGNVGFSELSLEDSTLRQYRIIFDFGLVDVDTRHLTIKDQKLSFSGTTSDMTVYSLEVCDDKLGKRYKVGDKIGFQPDYMAVARLMNSKFIDKVIK